MVVKNFHGAALLAETDGDEIGFLMSKVADIKRQP
jgi:hypothetical protein